MRTSPFSAALAALFLLSLAFRLIYIHDLKTYEFNDRLLLDPKAYDDRAVSILEDRDETDRPCYQAPLYPWILAGVYRVAGHDYDAVRLVQAFLGALTVVLIASLGARLFGTVAGLTAGLTAALYGPFPFYEAQIMKTGPGIALLIAGVLLLVRRGGALSLFAGGLLVGLAALIRENALLFLAAALLAELWGRRRGEGSLRRASILLAGAAVAILPVTLRNLSVSGDFVLVTSQGGQNFYIGNNEAARGTYTDLDFVRPDPRYEEDDFRRETVRRLGEEPSPSAISRYWYGESFRWIGENRRQAAALFLRKAALFWNGIELPDNQNFYYMQDRFSSLRLFPLRFGPVALFGIVGLLFSLRRFRSLFLVYAGLGTTFAALVAFYIVSRYRIPAVPFLILFAAEGARQTALAVRRRAGKRIVLIGACLALAAIPVYFVRPIDFDPRRDGYLPLHVNRAMLFADEGRKDAAVDEYRAALEIAPDLGELRKRLARLLVDEERFDEAAEEYVRAARLLPGDGGVRNDLALVHLRLGRREEAEGLFREAIAIDRRLESPRRNLARLLIEDGRTGEGRRWSEEADSLRAERTPPVTGTFRSRIESLLGSDDWTASGGVERLKRLASLRTGTPYELGCLGEAEEPDRDPLFRLDKADCTVLVLTDAALVRSRSLDEAVDWMKKIHYRDGVPTYRSRFHFTVDRLLSSPAFREITAECFPDSLLRTVEVHLNRDARGETLLPIEWERFVSVRYLPSRLLTTDLLDLLPDACGVAFVDRKNVDRGFLVSHEGILLDQTRLHHASSSAGKVIETDLLDYIRTGEESSRFDGVLFFSLVPSP